MLFANRAARELIGVGPDDPLPRVDMNEFFDTTPEQLAEMRAVDHRLRAMVGRARRTRRRPADPGVGGRHRAPRRERSLRVLLGAVARHHRAPRDRRGAAPQRGRAPVDRAVVAAADLRGRRRGHRARVEPRVRRALRMAVVRGDRLASRRSSTRPRRSRALTAPRVRRRDGSRRTRRATRGRDGRPLDVNVADRAAAQRGRPRRLRGRRASPTSATRSAPSSRCARARFGSGRSCRTRATWSRSSAPADGSRTAARARGGSSASTPKTDPDVPVDFGLFEEDRPALAALFERLRRDSGCVGDDPLPVPPGRRRAALDRDGGDQPQRRSRRARRRHERPRHHRPGRGRERRSARRRSG